MRAFDYERATDADAAVRAVAAPDTLALAGGTEMLNWMRLGVVAPARLVDIGGLSGGITLDDDHLAIGALATLNEVGEHPLVVAHAGVLAQACLKAASAQVRNRATLGGNVLQKTRCAYFRAEAPLPWPCNKREPGSGCAALEGLNERHAILGWTPDCVATQPSDPAVALACLDAELELLGPEGPRRLAMTDFHLTQVEAKALGGDAATLETGLAPGELIAGYRIPIRPGETFAYVKVRERESYEYALVSAACALKVENGVIAQARLALGSVAQKPWRLPAAEAALVGGLATREAALAAIRPALAEARPLSHNAYKIELAVRAAARAVAQAGAVQ